MDKRIERIVLETDRQQIVGDVHLPREGYRSRLSDFLNHCDDFVALVNAEIRPLNGAGSPERRDFIAVSRTHIKIAYPNTET